MASTRLYLRRFPSDTKGHLYLKHDEHGWYYQSETHLELVALPCGIEKSAVYRVSYRTLLPKDSSYLLTPSDLSIKEYHYKKTILISEYPQVDIVGPTLQEVQNSWRLLRAGKLRLYTPAGNSFTWILRRLVNQQV